MRGNWRTHSKPINLRNYKGAHVEITMNRHVPEFMCRELSRYPDSEEGGKYIGFMEKEREKIRIVVTDFLPGGPNAKRTRVEFFPDGEFQEKLFRHAERLNGTVEHLGSWHSHHCNGLRTLSEGDIDGYLKTVNKRNYQPDFFLASLVTEVPGNPQEQGWLRHYLFVRLDENFYDVTDEVAFTNVPNPFGEITGHVDARDETQITRPRRSHLEEVRSERWYESELGRQTLAADRKFFIEKFGHQLKTTRIKEHVRLTGTCPNGAELTMSYPAIETDSTVQITVNHSGRDVIRMSCDLDFRLRALEGAFKIVELL